MNALDIAVLTLLAFGAWRGFRNGLVIEVCSLLAYATGIWAALRYGAEVRIWLGLDTEHGAMAFMGTLLAVVILVRLLGWALTQVIDLAALGIPNKLAGLAFGTARMVLLAAVLLTCLPIAVGTRSLPSPDLCQRSVLYGPMRTFASILLPALRDSPWVQRTIQRVKEEVAPASH